jgi:flagellar biosynthesis/type III secretory pathway chaperone
MSEAQLTALLQQEIDLLEKLNEFSLLKKEALFKDDLRELEGILHEEDIAFREFKMIDDACSPQVQFFLKVHSDFTGVDAELKNRILKIRSLAAKLQTNNRFNMELIQDSLGLVQFTLNILTAPPGEKASTYSASGKVVGKNAKNHLLDRKG